jgi:hypothetical protein
MSRDSKMQIMLLFARAADRSAEVIHLVRIARRNGNRSGGLFCFKIFSFRLLLSSRRVL